MRRGWHFAGLAAAVLCAQLLLATHGIEHAFHGHDEACLECLVLPGFASVPAPLPRLLPPFTGPAGPAVAALPAPTFARRLSFRSRAPPSLHSR